MFCFVLKGNAFALAFTDGLFKKVFFIYFNWFPLEACYRETVFRTDPDSTRKALLGSSSYWDRIRFEVFFVFCFPPKSL